MSVYRTGLSFFFNNSIPDRVRHLPYRIPSLWSNRSPIFAVDEEFNSAASSSADCVPKNLCFDHTKENAVPVGFTCRNSPPTDQSQLITLRIDTVRRLFSSPDAGNSGASYTSLTRSPNFSDRVQAYRRDFYSRSQVASIPSLLPTVTENTYTHWKSANIPRFRLGHALTELDLAGQWNKALLRKPIRLEANQQIEMVVHCLAGRVDQIPETRRLVQLFFSVLIISVSSAQSLLDVLCQGSFIILSLLSWWPIPNRS